MLAKRPYEPPVLTALKLPFTIRKARYAKGNFIVQCPSQDGYKTRAARLIGDGLNCRYTNRCHGYVASPSKVKRFLKLYLEGWDASSFTRELQPPRGEVLA